MVRKSDGRGDGDSAQPEKDPRAGTPEPVPEPSGAAAVPDLGAAEPTPAAPLEMPEDAPAVDPDAPADPMIEGAPDPMIEAVVDTEADPAELPAAAGAEVAEAPRVEDADPTAESGPDAPDPWTGTDPVTDTPEDTPEARADAEDSLAGDRVEAVETTLPAAPPPYGAETGQESGFAPRAVAEDAHDHTHDHDHDHDHDDHEEGSSLAAKALTGLVLLLVGAGVGIWAAPKVAPVLPSGLAPVSAWLQPGAAEDSARIAALEARLAEVARPADIAAAVDAARSGLETEIATLRDTVAAGSSGALGERIGQLESALDGQRGEVAALKGQLEGLPADGRAAEAGAVAQIDVYRAELDGLRAEFDRLSGQVGSLSGRVEDVAATSTARVQEIEQTEGARADAAEVQADLAAIRAALVAGLPFADQAARLEAAGMTLPEGLEAAAASGAPSLADLQARFPAAAHEAIRVSILASAGDGFLARARAYVEAQIASRSLSPQPGATPDAILSRMDDDLAKGDLAGVLTESAALPSEATGALSDWLEGVKARQAADAALATLGGAQPAVTE